MFTIHYENCIPYVVVRRDKAEQDPRLDSKGTNTGRKILANKIRLDKSNHLDNAEWEPPTNIDGKSWILETGCGGLEVATFNEKSKQDRHKHKIATEMYVVLKGEMEIIVAGKMYVLSEGDEIIVLPGTPHEVMRKGKFLTRVHTMNCHGDEDRCTV